MAGLLDFIRRAAPGEAPVDPMAGSVMSPDYIPETDKRQLALGGLRGLLDVSPVGLLDAAIGAINRANVPSLAAVRAVTGRQGLPGDALVGLLGQGGGAGYEAARSATQAVVPMMGLLGNQSAGRLPAGAARTQAGGITSGARQHTVRSEHLNHAYGQDDFEFSVWKDADTPMGYATVSVYQGVPKIDMIEVAPQFKRQGVAKAIVDEIAKQHGGYKNIDWGYMTDDGAALRKSLDALYGAAKK